MRHSVLTQRDALRTKLLFGVAAIAASDPALANQAATALPDDSQKWSPYSSISGSAGSGMVGGKLDFFVPLFQDMDSLVFLNLGIGTETKARTLYNIGGGYRTEIDADWIVGAYVSYDSTQLQDNNNLGQAALGAELMSADWDVRLNGYIADNTAKPVPGEFGLSINGTTIAVLQAQDVGYSGFDGEIGYRVFADDNTDVRVFIGGFHFMHGDTSATSTGEHFDFSYRDITGPKARAEATVYDLDVLGNQSRVTLAGEIAHDDVRGTTGFVSATLRIALGNFTGSGGAQALGELDRRMVDPERRNDTVLARAEFTRPEPVIIYGNGVKSQPTNTLLYVDNTQGAGTYANPTTFADATSRPTTNAFIVLTSKQGPIMGGGTLQPGQSVVAGGETFSVQGVYSHATFSHLFDPSTNVTLMPSSPGANVITLAPNTTVHGFNIVGDFGNAIYGKNVHNVTIDSVAIEGTGGGVNGINIVRTVSGNQNVTITNTSVADVSGVGIRFDTHVYDGGTSSLTTTLNNVVVTRVGHEGLQINTYAEGVGSSITSHVSVSNFSTFAAGTDGVDITTVAAGTGSKLAETLSFSNDLVSGPLEDGIFIDTYAVTGAALTSNVTLSGLTIQAARHDGIYVDAHSVDTGATLAQTLSVTNSTIARSGYYAVALNTYALRGGQTTSNASLSGLALNGANFGGLHAYAGAYGAGSVTNQTLAVDTVGVNNVGGEGVGIFASVRMGAHVTEAASLSNSTVTGVGYTGVEASAVANDYGSSIAQSLQFSNLHISDIGTDGLTVSAQVIDGTVQQSVSIANTEVSNVGTSAPASYGIEISAAALVTYIHQATTMTNTLVADVSGKYGNVGIDFSASAGNNGAIVQTQTISSSSATDAGTGLRIAASAFDCSCGPTTVDQRTTVTNGSFDDNALRGIDINGLVGTFFGRYTSKSAIYQGVTVANTTLDRNGTGLFVSGQAYAGASVTQTVNLTGMEIGQNTGDGVDLLATAHALAFTGQNVTFNGTTSSFNDISHNGGNGVFIGANTDSAGQILQNVDVYYTNVDHNGATGIHAINTATGYQIPYGAQTYYSHIQQNLLMGPGSVSHNAANGIALYNTAKYGAAIDQIVQVYKMTVDHNGGDGFLENSIVTTFNGSGLYRPTDLHSNVYVYQSDLSHNGRNGISIHSTLSSPQYAVTAHGYSYLEQHITVSGSTVDHNKYSGFDDYAVDSGVFGINIQYVTLSGSSFSHNQGNGAGIFARQFFGPGAFGATVQDVTIAGSTFDHNAESGLYAYAYAGGNQGRAEQHFTVQSLAVSATTTLASHFDNNGYYGIALKHVARNGVYVSGLPCTKAQGLTGGCAFVRATFAMLGGSADNNRLYGLSINSYAGHYGAIYDAGGRPHSPTVYLNGVLLDGNSAGFEQVTAASDHSYAFSFVVAIDTAFDGNRQNGFGTVSYATKGSAILEQNILYSYKTGTSADKNGNVGVSLISRATDGSAVYSQNRLYGHTSGISASHNGYDGVFIATGYDDATSRAQQVSYLGGNTISFNGRDGVALIAYGPGAGSVGGGYQFSKFVANTIASNGRYGIYGVAAAGATQVIDAFAGMNMLPGNGIAKLHLKNVGAAQTIY